MLEFPYQINLNLKILRVCSKENIRINMIVWHSWILLWTIIFIPFLDQVINELRTRFDVK